MNKKQLVIVLILGLIIGVNCADDNPTNGTNAANTTTGGNVTTGNGTANSTSESAQQAFLWFYNQVKTLVPSEDPTGVADNFKLYVNQITNMSANLNEFGVILANKNSTKDSVSNYANLSATWDDFTSTQGKVYASVASILAVLGYAKDDSDCYGIFDFADSEGYLTTTALMTYFFNNDSSQEEETYQKLQSVCLSEVDNAQAILDIQLDSLIGAGDQKCNILQDLYEGLPSVYIFTGNIQLISNVLGYILLNIQWLQMSTSACLSLNGTDASQNVTSRYQDKVQLVIDRYFEIDQNITNNLNETIAVNLQSVVDEFSFGLKPSAYLAANNIGFYMLVSYPNLKWLIFVYDSNSTSNDSAVVSCKHCFQLKDQNGLNIVVDWVQGNSTTSLSNSTLDSLSQNATGGAQSIVNEINSGNNCTSGVIAIGSGIDQYVVQNLDERYHTINTTDLNVYVWGVQEDCQGQA